MIVCEKGKVGMEAATSASIRAKLRLVAANIWSASALNCVVQIRRASCSSRASCLRGSRFAKMQGCVIAHVTEQRQGLETHFSGSIALVDKLKTEPLRCAFVFGNG